MCGIFGAVLGDGSPLRRESRLLGEISRLYRLSASRGKEAAGLAVANDDALVVFKRPVPADELIKTSQFRAIVRDEIGRPRSRRATAFIGHSRLVTDGAREDNANNQPVIGDGVVGIHNGIVVNHDALWKKYPELQRHYDVDSEVIFALLRHHLGGGASLPQAAAKVFGEIKGAASIAAVFAEREQLLIATNNGSLYYARVSPQTFVFASERYILEQFLQKSQLRAEEIRGVAPGEGLVVSLATLELTPFTFAAAPATSDPLRERPRAILDRSPAASALRRVRRETPNLDALAERYPYRPTTHELRRCTKCVLPDSMPFITFDAEGVCSYCRRYQKITVRGAEALEELVRPHRRTDGRPDVVVGVSGGRDSMYGLHYVKTVLKMNPVAFTYDWGMVTDLARRNVSRICGKLGIEHILVSADIDQKRSFIRKNVEAWLKRPSLGTIPLFMAGDKAYFHYLNQVRAQLGTPFGVLCENLLERTDFKTGYAGVPPQVVDDVRAYTLHPGSKIKLASYYLKEFAQNPSYINTSVIDTAMAYFFYYVMDRSYTNLYGYVRWQEDVVNRTLIDEYDFELAEDTETTWRIGDGTAPFYNYIYHTVSGFTEHDTLRSNQIREGVLTREKALELIDRENRPRFPSIHWYLAALGLDGRMEQIVETINRIPKTYTRVPRVAQPVAAGTASPPDVRVSA
jgi:predicted glutamine amidotransferase